MVQLAPLEALLLLAQVDLVVHLVHPDQTDLQDHLILQEQVVLQVQVVAQVLTVHLDNQLLPVHQAQADRTDPPD